mgnify:CR=1 FL=1
MINNNKNNKTKTNNKNNDKRYNIYVVSFSDNVDKEKIEEVLNAKERFEKILSDRRTCDRSGHFIFLGCKNGYDESLHKR